ncbi:3-hydroxyacyl-ACP dehydratase FabZ family protein [Amycolatopsis sp. cmx-11-51]|uniref:3-hydroxyacyl-ACP dehydratase FabZ family protein n=1 Tax=unclassified Amycolatopsis TaxID=2618356 RepID=UPI0039E2E154
MTGHVDIGSLLPHTYPMLLVDEVVHVVPGERLVARKSVTCNEPWYARTGSDAPGTAYPPNLVLESWAQAAGALGLMSLPDTDHPPVLGSVTGVRFLTEVLPGAVLEHHVRLERMLKDVLLFSGSSMVAGATVLTVERMVAAIRTVDQLRPQHLKERR